MRQIIRLFIVSMLGAAIALPVCSTTPATNYDDCILNNLKGTESNAAVQAIKEACASKFSPNQRLGKGLFFPEIKPATSFFNIYLGDSHETMVLKLGKYDRFIEKNNFVQYDDRDLTIHFDNQQRVDSILYHCSEKILIPNLPKIRCGISETELRRGLRTSGLSLDYQIQCGKDQRLTYWIKKLNLAYVVLKGEVAALAVTSRTPLATEICKG